MRQRHGVYDECGTWFVYIKNRPIAYAQSEVEAQYIFEQELTEPGSVVPRRKNKAKYSSSPEAQKVANNNKRAEKMNAFGKITVDEWLEICERFGNCCISCGLPWRKLTIDHVVPLILGGTNIIKNIQPLCRSCNSSKHTQIIDYRLCPAQPIPSRHETET